MLYLVVSIPELCTLTYFAIILKGKRELVDLLSLSSWCLVMVVGQVWYLIVSIPDLFPLSYIVTMVIPVHIHLLFVCFLG